MTGRCEFSNLGCCDTCRYWPSHVRHTRLVDLYLSEFDYGFAPNPSPTEGYA